jgi:hypothetical protein
MSRDLADIAADLDSLAGPDFDPMNVGSSGDERLLAICIELGERDDAEWWAPLLYSFMERLDEVDLGSPGPIVHLLEAWGGYRPLLTESLQRKPTSLTVWMANRVLNSDPPDAPAWLSLLRNAETHPAASTAAQTDAHNFVKYQAARR